MSVTGISTQQTSPTCRTNNERERTDVITTTSTKSGIKAGNDVLVGDIPGRLVDKIYPSPTFFGFDYGCWRDWLGSGDVDEGAQSQLTF